jgi:5-enolpyruvylshikimate-3-phosphate synthase
MTGAIAALVADGPVDVNGWETVASSYPSFLDDLNSLRSA